MLTFAVNYGSIDQIAKTLDQHKVYTVILTIVMNDLVAAQLERTLIEAAEKSVNQIIRLAEEATGEIRTSRYCTLG